MLSPPFDLVSFAAQINREFKVCFANLMHMNGLIGLALHKIALLQRENEELRRMLEQQLDEKRMLEQALSKTIKRER